VETVKMRVTNPTAISIGRVTENLVKLVEIDISEWRTAFPYLENYSVIVKNPDGASYPAVTETDGDKLLWTITASDTGKAGKGFFQISAQGENGEKKLSAPQSFTINAVLPAFTQEEPPEALKGYVDKILSAADRAENAAKTAINPPIIGENGNWFLFDFEKGEYTDSGFPSVGIGPKGDKGDKGDQGDNGYTPVKGTDYFTTDEKDELVDEVLGRMDVVEDSGWVTMQLVNAIAQETPKYRKIGNRVNIAGSFKLTSELGTSATRTIYTLPEGFHPSYTVRVPINVGTGHAAIQVYTNGSIIVYNLYTEKITTSPQLFICLDFLTD